MFTLEAFDESSTSHGWRELPALYFSAEEALDQAERHWEDLDHLYTRMRLKRTVTVCTLIRPDPNEER